MILPNRWEDFIESERKNSKVQYLNNYFDLEKYKFLKPLFNSLKIDEILEIIDDILKKEKFEKIDRFFIFNDFFWFKRS